jgi:hypothetical protein
MVPEAQERCELCERPALRLTRHHLVPRSRTKKKRRKGRPFDRRDFERTVLLCPPCHRNVHAVLDHKDLERDYHTVEALKKHPDVRRFTAWIRTKPHGTVRR